jgi:hypothetical protein
VEDACVPGDGDDTEPTTGDPESDTDGPSKEWWICSPSADENCQDRTGEGLNASDPACWAPDGKSDCVEAANFDDAVTACQCLCENDDDVLTDACDSPGVCEVESHLDCMLSSAGETPILAVGNADVALCDSTLDADKVACPTTTKIFDATVGGVLADGTSSTVTGLVGYLDYSISSCSSGSCVFETSLLLIPHRDVSGVAVLAGTTPYAITDFAAQMDGTLTGVFQQSNGNITFPSSTMTVSATLNSVTYNNIALPILTPGERLTLSTDQMVGNRRSSTGPLKLNLIFDIPGGTAMVSLETR